MKHSTLTFISKATVGMVSRLFILSIFFIFHHPINAQITVPSSTFPASGDKLRYKTASNPGIAISLFTPPGGNQSWDLSGLTEGSTFVEDYQPAANGVNNAKFPGATLLLLKGTDEYYYKSSSTRFDFIGYHTNTIGGLPIVNADYVNAPALAVRHAPLNFFDIYSGSTGNLLGWDKKEIPNGAISLPAQYDSIRIRIAESNVEAVDGWGTLTLPGAAQFSVLRLKKTAYRERRIDAKVPPLGWLDVTDNVIQSGGAWSGLFGVDTTVTHHYFNDVSKEEIAVLTFNTDQNAVLSVVYKNVNSCPNGLVTPSVSLVVSPSMPVCPGTSLTFTATPTNGGTTPTYKWFLNNNEIIGETGTTLTRTNFVNNDVVKVVMTADGTCFTSPTATAMQTINLLSRPNLSTTQANVTCFGGSNGAIDLTVSGGIAPYTYNWGNGLPNIQDQTNLPAGTYTVIVFSANGCSNTTTVTITEPSALTLSLGNANSGIKNVSCNGGNDGAIDLTVSGGTPVYTYRWSDVANTQDRTGLTARTYTVTVTDANACPKSATFTITEPPALNLSTTQTNVSCNGGNNGSIDLTVTGGTPGYTYRWADGATTQDRAVLKAGTYTVTVTDANLCTKSTSVTITEPLAVNASVTLSVAPSTTICAGTSVTFTATPTNGGIAPTYKWFLNNTLLNGETSATLTRNNLANNDVVKVEMTSNSICVSNPIVSAQVTMTVNLSPQVDAVANMDYCSGSSVPSIVLSSNISGASIEWSRTGGDIGLAATSGTGNIPSFTAKNNGTTPLIITFSYVASFTTNGQKCYGTPKQFTMTIYPSPQVNAVENKAYCTGIDVPSVVFSSNVAGAEFEWSRTGGDIGLPTTAGTGNIPSFTATNTGTTPITVTFSVVASFTYNNKKCYGTPIQFTMTISPLPVITCPTPPISPINCPATPVFGTATSSNASVTFTDSKIQGSCPGNYTITRTWTAANGCTPVATCSQSVVVQDKEKPKVTKTDELVSCYPTVAAAEKAALGLTQATDNCSTNLIKTVSTSGTCPFMIKVTVTDECGNADFVEYALQDVAAKGGKVVLQSNMTSTSGTICPGQTVALKLNNHFGRVVTWQITDANSPVWLDIPGTAGLTEYTFTGSVSTTTYFRCVICATCGICTPPSYTAYSGVFRLSPRSACPLNDPSVKTTNYGLLLSKAYPSPASDKVTLEIDRAKEGIAHIEIADITGRIIERLQRPLTEGYNEVTLDIQNLASGLHFIKIKDSGNHEATVKMSKM